MVIPVEFTRMEKRRYESTITVKISKSGCYVLILDIFANPNPINLMNENLEEQVLLKFKNGLEKVPVFENKNEQKIFLQLQKYNLIYVTTDGIFTLSKKGKEALKYGVDEFLVLERFEERLIKDSLTRGIERKWLYFAIIPIILILSCWMISLLD